MNCSQSLTIFEHGLFIFDKKSNPISLYDWQEQLLGIFAIHIYIQFYVDILGMRAGRHCRYSSTTHGRSIPEVGSMKRIDAYGAEGVPGPPLWSGILSKKNNCRFSETGSKGYANYQTHNAHRSPITFCPPGAACCRQGSSIGSW